MARTLPAMIGGLVYQKILQRDLIAFHALQLGDLDYLAAAVLEAALLNDQLHRASNLSTDDLKGQIHAGHQRQRFQTAHTVTWRVRVDSGQRTVVARVHG